MGPTIIGPLIYGTYFNQLQGLIKVRLGRLATLIPTVDGSLKSGVKTS